MSRSNKRKQRDPSHCATPEPIPIPAHRPTSTSTPLLRLDRGALFKQLGYLPHAGQAEVHRSRAPRRVLACGVRWGKTKCAAMEAIAASLEPRAECLGWIVAPTYDLADRVFREVIKVVQQHLKHRVIRWSESERRLSLRNYGGGVSEIRAKSADNPTSLLGEGLDFVILDEAARTHASIWDSYLSQRLIDRQGWALLISTPFGKGWFYDIWRQGQGGRDPGTISWNQPSLQNPLLDPAEIELERGRLPEQVFRQEYEAVFIEEAGCVFRDVREVATGQFEAPIPGVRYYAGLDLARVQDYTVLTIMDERRRVVHIDRFHRMNWDSQLERIQLSLARYNRAKVMVDSNGMGDPIYEAMAGLGCRVKPYLMTSNSKTSLINNLALAIEQRKIVLPSVQVFPECVEELEAYQYELSDSGHRRMSSPYGKHDDVVISVALALWATRLKPRVVHIGMLNGLGVSVARTIIVE